MAKNTQSAEPKVAELGNGWLKKHHLDYKLEHQSLNSEIDAALTEYASKSGGSGGNRPDAKLIVIGEDMKDYPVLIEYKGYKDRLVKLDEAGQVENNNKKNEPNYTNIKSYAVNGAIHYANALLHYTRYTEVIAIGMTGYIDEAGRLRHDIGVWYVAKTNYGAGQKVGEFTDFSFLAKEHLNSFLARVKNLTLTEEERERIKARREAEINLSLLKLNNDIYQNEKGLSEQDRVYLVVASIMATLGIPNKVTPLEKNDLSSSAEEGETDGDILMRKVENFLKARQLPKRKRAMIVRSLTNIVTAENINKPTNGETQLKRVFTKIVDDLGIYYKIGLTTDFTGKLFNEMYNWLGFTQDKLNDVVLTPPYVARLLVRLARTNMDSFVWDNATGSAGLLVAAMNEMIKDARKNIKSPAALTKKEAAIRANQLLGIEILPAVYMLAVLNMILMGDGSSNILNEDSLKDFDGKYHSEDSEGAPFPANVFVLNPPYSVKSNGMNFVRSALSKMKTGYAAIIIQSSAGSGKATEECRDILKGNTLLASIKMPIDLFLGKSSVQTNVYVFRVGEKHERESVVKFIDFSNDGYTRTNRKKARVNLKDTDHANERYDELVDLVKFGRSQLHFFTEKEYYEGTIDPEKGNDWNQSAPTDTRPRLSDFKKTVRDYLAFEVTNLLAREAASKKGDAPLDERLSTVEWGEWRLGDLFEVSPSKKRFDANKVTVLQEGGHPYIVRLGADNGQKGFIDEDEKFLNAGNTISFGQDTATIYYQEKPYFTGDKIKILSAKFDKFGKRNALFFISAIQKAFGQFSWGDSFNVDVIKSRKIFLPVKGGEIDFEFMEGFIAELKAERIAELKAYLKAAGLLNPRLTASERRLIESEEPAGTEWGEWRIGDLFEGASGTFDIQKKHINGKGEWVITAGLTNNGVLGKSDVAAKIFTSNTVTVDMFGYAFFRPCEYKMATHARVFSLRPNFSLTEKSGLFIAGSLRYLQKFFGYDNMCSWEKIKNRKIFLPTKNGEIDFDFMEKYIVAVEKYVIADVADYAKREFAAAKEAAGRV